MKIKEDNGLMLLKFGFRKTRTSLLAVLVVALLSDPLLARTILVNVDGMVCYSCAFGIQKMCKIEKIGKGYEKDIEKGLFKISLAPNEQIPDPKKLKEIVHNAGYTYRGANMEVKGTILPQIKGQKISVRLAESNQVMWVGAKPEVRSGLNLNDGREHLLLLEAGEEPKEWTLQSVKTAEETEKQVQ